MASPRNPTKKNDRRQQLRSAARTRGTATVPPPSPGSGNPTYEQLLLMLCAVVLLVGVMAVHALGALVYGQLSLFVLVGFVDLRGRTAVCAGAAEMAFVLGAALQFASGYRGFGERALSRLQTLRLSAYVLVIPLALVAVVLRWIDKPRIELKYPLGWPGLAPQSEWLLTPLPWVWQDILPVAHDRVGPWLLLAAMATGFVGVWCFAAANKKPRLGLVFLGLASVTGGFWSLGGAAYHYVAGRGLANVHDAELAALLQARPGLYNADTLLWLLGAGSLTMAGALLLASAVFLPKPRPYSSTENFT